MLLRDQQLVDGWRAARAGQPFDEAESELWREGYAIGHRALREQQARQWFRAFGRRSRSPASQDREAVCRPF